MRANQSLERRWWESFNKTLNKFYTDFFNRVATWGIEKVCLISTGDIRPDDDVWMVRYKFVEWLIHFGPTGEIVLIEVYTLQLKDSDWDWHCNIFNRNIHCETPKELKTKLDALLIEYKDQLAPIQNINKLKLENPEFTNMDFFK